jgi:DNA-binding transcriptional ArsR family regulator
MNYRLYREFFRAVANPVRFGIVERLRRGPAPVGDLAAELRLGQSHVSHALACLLQCGFVLRSAEGKQRVYRINPEIEDILAKVERQLDRYAGELEQCQVLASERRPKVIVALPRPTAPERMAIAPRPRRRGAGRKP